MYLHVEVFDVGVVLAVVLMIVRKNEYEIGLEPSAVTERVYLDGSWRLQQAVAMTKAPVRREAKAGKEAGIGGQGEAEMAQKLGLAVGEVALTVLCQLNPQSSE